MPVVSVAMESIAAGGDGVGRKDGLVIFVPRTAPGDVVTAQISARGRFARGALRSLVTPSPVRIEPHCPHFSRDKCGGCQLQHMTYDSQLAAKQTIVRDSLERIGKRRGDLPPIERSPAEWRYRSKLTLAIRRRGARWIAGLHPYDEPGRVFSLSDCPITDQRVVAAWREVMAADTHFPDAEQLRGSVRLTGGEPTLVMMGGESWAAREQFLAAVPSLSAVWWEPDDVRPRRLVFDRRAERSPGASFAQVNPGMAVILRTYVLEQVRAFAPRTIVDAYAGAGEIASALSAEGRTVTAIELDPDASGWSATRLGLPSVALGGRVEDLLPSALPADLVILNPPRAGIDIRVAEALELNAALVRAVVYVSCNPATLARDVSRLPGYDIESVRAFDMFPQTAHVETVCVLRSVQRQGTT